MNYCKKVLLIGALFLLIDCLYAIEDYCSVNQFPNLGNYLQFTKEPSTFEYAIEGKFKGLHCCAKGYKSIEWYKNGKPYPWHDTVAPLIIYPESSNQTVYTQTVTVEDAGNYTCVLRNDSTVHVHTIALVVFDKLPDDPKITYISEDMAVSLTKSIRLFCEAFVGRIDLPDAYNEAVWRKSGENVTVQKEKKNSHQYTVMREDGQTFGTYLIIDNMKNDDFGEYICSISKPGKTIELSTYLYEKVNVNEYKNPNPMPTKEILLLIGSICLLFLTGFVLYCTYGLVIRVYLKDRYGSRAQNKPNDVLILYSPNDTHVALGVLLPTLQTNYNYKCKTEELPLGTDIWCTKLEESVRRSSSVVVVMSPSCLNEKWDCNVLYEAFKQLQHLNSKFCCIMLKEMPTLKNQLKNSQGETLRSVIKNANIMYWEKSREIKFWLTLRLSLPPKLNLVNNLEEIRVTNNENNTRLILN